MFHNVAINPLINERARHVLDVGSVAFLPEVCARLQLLAACPKPPLSRARARVGLVALPHTDSSSHIVLALVFESWVEVYRTEVYVCVCVCLCVYVFPETASHLLHLPPFRCCCKQQYVSLQDFKRVSTWLVSLSVDACDALRWLCLCVFVSV